MSRTLRWHQHIIDHVQVSGSGLIISSAMAASSVLIRLQHGAPQRVDVSEQVLYADPGGAIDVDLAVASTFGLGLFTSHGQDVWDVARATVDMMDLTAL